MGPKLRRELTDKEMKHIIHLKRDLKLTDRVIRERTGHSYDTVKKVMDSVTVR